MIALVASLLLLNALVATVQGNEQEIPAIGSTAHFFDEEFHVLGGSDGFDWYNSHLKFSPESGAGKLYFASCPILRLSQLNCPDDWTEHPEVESNLTFASVFPSSAVYRSSLFIFSAGTGLEVKNLRKLHFELMSCVQHSHPF